jgi:hypothetical protein
VLPKSSVGFAADVNKEPCFISVLPGTLLDSSIPQAFEDRHFMKFEILLPMLGAQYDYCWCDLCPFETAP